MMPKGIENIDLYTANVVRGIVRNGLGAHLNERTDIKITHEYVGDRLIIHINLYNPRAYTHHETSCSIALDPEHR
jgi:hypothetical protein